MLCLQLLDRAIAKKCVYDCTHSRPLPPHKREKANVMSTTTPKTTKNDGRSQVDSPSHAVKMKQTKPISETSFVYPGFFSHFLFFREKRQDFFIFYQNIYWTSKGGFTGSLPSTFQGRITPCSKSNFLGHIGVFCTNFLSELIYIQFSTSSSSNTSKKR